MMRSFLVLTFLLCGPAWADVLIPLRNIRAQEIVTRELEAHTIEDLQKPVTKDYIRRTLQKKFNNDLEGAGYSTPVGKVVFSKWVMQ